METVTKRAVPNGVTMTGHLAHEFTAAVRR